MIRDPDLVIQRLDDGHRRPKSTLPGWVISLAVHAVICACCALCVDRPSGLNRDQLYAGGQPPHITTRFSSAELAEYSGAGLEPEFTVQAATGNPATHAPPEQLPAADQEPLEPAASDSIPPSQPTEVDSETSTTPETLASTNHNSLIKPKYAQLLQAATASSRSVSKLSEIAATEGKLGPAGRPDGTAVGTSFFDISAEGNVFCYVVDSSSSMDQDDAIGMARDELIASLQQLQTTQRFQILFYDSELHPLTNGKQQTFSATDAHLKFASQFILSQQTSGGTVHQPALLAALKLAPDVIFFLTDGETSELCARDLQQIKQFNRRRIKIHVIQFGSGAKLGSFNWLEQLATDHRGSYRYQDISR